MNTHGFDANVNYHSVAVRLTRGLSATVDKADAALVAPYRWFALHAQNGFYACASVPRALRGDRQKIYMHRLLLNAEPGIDIDHVNGDSLDNRRINLRPCSHADNTRNKHRAWGAIGFKGVSFNDERYRLRYRAGIFDGVRRLELGSFASADEAARAYDAAAIRLFGEFARTNQSLGLIGAANE